MHSLTRSFNYAFECKNWELVKLMIDKGACVNTLVSSRGNASVLNMAIQEGHHGIVSMLIKRGANVAYNDLTMAIMRGRCDILTTLLRSNTLVNAQYVDHLLFWSATVLDVSVSKLLLLYGCDPTKTRLDGKTPADVACEIGNYKVAAFLRRAEKDVIVQPIQADHCVIDACKTMNLNKLIDVLKNGGNPDAMDSMGITALHIAIKNNHPAFVKQLLLNGAKPDGITNMHFTPLTLAITHGIHANINTKTLLNHGADPNLPVASGEMPLHVVCKTKWSTPLLGRSIACLLLSNGADCTIPFKRKLPLEIAFQHCNAAITEEIKKYL